MVVERKKPGKIRYLMKRCQPRKATPPLRPGEALDRAAFERGVDLGRIDGFRNRAHRLEERRVEGRRAHFQPSDVEPRFLAELGLVDEPDRELLGRVEIAPAEDDRVRPLGPGGGEQVVAAVLAPFLRRNVGDPGQLRFGLRGGVIGGRRHDDVDQAALQGRALLAGRCDLRPAEIFQLNLALVLRHLLDEGLQKGLRLIVLRPERRRHLELGRRLGGQRDRRRG